MFMSIRDRFPIFKNKIYMNSCSQGALSLDVQEAYAHYLRDWVERMEAARQAFCGLVNAEASEVAVTTSASAGVSALGMDIF